MADMYYNSKDVDYDAFYRQVGGDRYKPASSVTAQGLAIRPVQTVPINPATGSPVQVSPTAAQTRAEQTAARSVINNIPTQGVQGAGTVAMPPGVRPNVTIPPLPSSRDERLPTLNIVPGDPIGPISPDSSMVIRNYSPTTGFSEPLVGKVAPIPMTFPGIMPVTPAATNPVARALAGGSSDIRSIQQQLQAAGFSPGAIDGIMGKNTDAAIRAFQQARGLAVDGIVGPQTLAALQGGAPAQRATSSSPSKSSTSSVASALSTGSGKTVSVGGQKVKAGSVINNGGVPSRVMVNSKGVVTLKPV